MRWGIGLVAVGVFWLFANLGWFSWDWLVGVWELWPLALMLVGLGMVLQDHRQRIPILIGVGLLGTALLWGWQERSALRTQTQNLAIGLQGVSRAEIALEHGLGPLNLTAKDGPNILEGQIELLPGQRLLRTSNLRGGNLELRLSTQGKVSPNRMRATQGWNLSLSPKVPLQLSIDSGVGENQLDLRQLKLESLEVNSGVGRTHVQLPPQGHYKAKIEGGVGPIEVEVPPSIGLHLEVDAGLGGTQVPAGLVTLGEGRYESQGYSEAKDQAELEVSGGVGRIEVRR